MLELLSPMSLSNPWFLLALLATVGLWKLELIATLLNMSALAPEVPPRLRGIMTEEEHERARDYACVSAKSDLLQASITLGLFLVFWWCGGFGWLDRYLASFGWSDLRTGLTLFAILFLAQGLVRLPFEVYDTFVIEERFGFNKTTPVTFVMDRLKELALAAILGLPLLALLLWLFGREPLAALYGWLIVNSFTLVLSFLAPRLILPLFFKIEPLQDAALKDEIMALSQRLGFPVAEVSMVDGSRRSTKANAFFTGFGRTKRIALYDTLLKNSSREEILAVLAHEIGHNKCHHVPKQLVLSLATSAIIFALLHFALTDPRVCAAFGVPHPTVPIAWGMAFFAILLAPLGTVLGLFSGWLSRKFEFEADAFARSAMQSPKPLAEALTRFTKDHLGNPTPHPFYVALHYSHPPVLQRLAALESSS
jgi:STE24 endopeptidase